MVDHIQLYGSESGEHGQFKPYTNRHVGNISVNMARMKKVHKTKVY